MGNFLTGITGMGITEIFAWIIDQVRKTLCLIAMVSWKRFVWDH